MQIIRSPPPRDAIWTNYDARARARRDTPSRACEALRRPVEGRIGHGETKNECRSHRLLGIERGDRNRGNAMLGHKPLAERFVIDVEAEWGEIDADKIAGLARQDRKADMSQAFTETIARALKIPTRALAREARHHLEYGRVDIRENRVHAG
jgi:hypothetical protein